MSLREAPLRRASHPLYDPRHRLKLGIFGPNVSNGCTISTASTFGAGWQENLRIAQMADLYGLDALVPVGRWKGFGGSTDFNGTCLEVYTWAAAIAARTERISVFATSHVPTVHPILAAKQAATIDHISGGRFGINVVCGWYTPEMEMFGATQLPHDDRYARATEWIQACKRLWSEQDFDFEGTYYRIRGGYLLPKPVQQPWPVLINAGISPAGLDYAAREMDVNFAIVTTLEEGRGLLEHIRARARGYGREIGIMTSAAMVCRDTEAQARAAWDDIVAQGDWGALESLLITFGVQSQSMDPAAARALTERFIVGWGGYPLVGTPEQVVEEMGRLADIGVDILLLSWLDYEAELRHFGERVLPLMRQAGLRG
jgi:dimethylsulfone monooxygenase